MFQQFIESFLEKDVQEPLVSVDIGTSSIKIMELDVTGEAPRLIALGTAPTPAGVINNHLITNPTTVAATVRTILDANDIQTNRAVVAIPGPCVFTKKVTLSKMSLKDLALNIQFEAGNYIPHSIDAVHLDYQVLDAKEDKMDVLLVAVKNDIVNSYLSALEQAGLEPSIADVDYFALENMFEVNYPEQNTNTIALVNIGSRYASVNIIQDGESLFTGDVGVGGRLYTDALCETLEMEPRQAEQAKMGSVPEGFDPLLITETIERTTEHMASELQRQIGFFWNAAATDRAIDAVYLCGGGAQVNGLLETLSAKVGMTCEFVEALRGIECGENFDQDFLEELAPAMAVSVGLASRRLGDKENAVS